jgi:RimJ/RimL family protein N-acetyltransferase
MTRPMLAGDRLRLRPIERSDLDAFIANAQDPLVGEIAGFTEPMGRAGAERWFDRTNARTQSGEMAYFVVSELNDDRFIGAISLRGIEVQHGHGELGIFMDRDHQGHGWGSEAQRVLLDYAFGELRLERVSLTVSPSNARAIRSYEKVGFSREAVLRHAYWHHGAWEDAILMGILRDEWLSQNRPRSWQLGESGETDRPEG